MSTNRFVQSLPGPQAYEFFGFEVKLMTRDILNYLQNLKDNHDLKFDFVEMTQAGTEELNRH